MPKTAYRRLTKLQREHIANVASKRFAEGVSACDVCRRLGIHYSSLKHICNQYQIPVPKLRGQLAASKSAA